MHQPWINEGIIRCEESIPWLVAGVVLAAILPEILVVNKLLHSRFGNDAPAVSAAVKAALLGLFSPFSASTGGSLPIAISLAHMKCSCVAVTTFVMVGQAGGFDSFILSLGFVGIPTALFGLLAPLFTGVCGGLVASIHKRIKPVKEYMHHHHNRRNGIPFGVWLQNFTLRVLDVFGRTVFVAFLNIFLTTFVLSLLPAITSLPLSETAPFGSWYELLRSFQFRLSILAACIPLQLNEQESLDFALRLVGNHNITSGLGFGVFLLSSTMSLATLFVLADIYSRFARGLTTLIYLVGATLISTLQLTYALDYLELDLIPRYAPPMLSFPLWFKDYAKITAALIAFVCICKNSLSWFFFSKEKVKLE